MPNLSADQLTNIAQQYHDLAFKVGQYRLDKIHAGAGLEDPKIVQLLGLHFTLLNTSSSFALQAAKARLDDADKAAAQITNATKTAKDAINKLENIDKIINIASAAGVLAVVVMTGNMGQIGTAVQGVLSAANPVNS